MTEKPSDEILFICLIEYYERSLKLWAWCVLKILHILTHDLPVDDQEALRAKKHIENPRNLLKHDTLVHGEKITSLLSISAQQEVETQN